MTVGQLLAQDGVLAPELLGRLEGHFEGPQLTAHKRISLHGSGTTRGRVGASTLDPSPDPALEADHRYSPSDDSM